MITQELRKYVLSDVPSEYFETLIDIADAIEQKHEEGLAQASAKVLADCISVANDFIELPKDADGVTIRIGDEVEYGHNVGTVDRLLLNESDEPRVGTTFGGYFYGIELHHAKPDSWERIIEDAAENIYPNGAFNPCWTEVRDALVERCKRLAGDAE